MEVEFDKENQRVPIKFWLSSKDSIEDGAWNQALNMSNLPFTHKHIALMPDVHQGYGVPIGGVMALEDIVIPHAVGVDISCGVQAVKTDIEAEKLREVKISNTPIGKRIGQAIKDLIPLGFDRYDEPQYDSNDYLNPTISEDVWGYDKLSEEGEFETAKRQLGTLGGGNHFIELQEDLNTGRLWVMVHSGSRHLGYAIAKLFDEKAKALNKKWYSEVPEDWELAFLPAHHDMGQAYIHWMNVASDFAEKNRSRILDKVLNVIEGHFNTWDNTKPTFGDKIECNHNYANLENHFNRNVYVHRKGAIRAKEGEMGIIPGSMGSYSYIVQGKGNKYSFSSASHGAGRRMSRNEAKRRYKTEDMLQDFKDREIFLSTGSEADDVLDEYTKAYKNVEDVIKHQEELVETITKLETVVVIKG